MKLGAAGRRPQRGQRFSFLPGSAPGVARNGRPLFLLHDQAGEAIDRSGDAAVEDVLKPRTMRVALPPPSAVKTARTQVHGALAGPWPPPPFFFGRQRDIGSVVINPGSLS